MELSDALAKVKKRLDISGDDTTFDDDIQDMIADSVKMLYPYAQRELDEQEKDISPDLSGRVNIDLNSFDTPIDGVRFVEVQDLSGFWYPATYSIHSNTLTLSDVDSSYTKAAVYGLGKFTLETLYDYLEMAVIYYAISEFYKFLIGNKRKYNVYMNNGRPAVENMQDVSDYFAQLANQYLSDRATVYGES